MDQRRPIGDGNKRRAEAAYPVVQANLGETAQGIISRGRTRRPEEQEASREEAQLNEARQLGEGTKQAKTAKRTTRAEEQRDRNSKRTRRGTNLRETNASERTMTAANRKRQDSRRTLADKTQKNKERENGER